MYISAKIRNIEATEEAKLKMLKERSSKKDLPSQFVPTNMAVNFVQHNRCESSMIFKIHTYLSNDFLIIVNIEEPGGPAKKKEVKEVIIKKPFVVGMDPEPSGGKRSRDGDKATDDYHYEKFKKQFRRF